MIIVEICTQSYRAALNAFESGAHRIELCEDLPTGGLTPSPKVITQVVQKVSIPVFVLIRMRPGNFVYNRSELDQMNEEIKTCVDLGASGIVCGALTESLEIDEYALNSFMRFSAGLPITFHRAFELVPDPLKSMDMLMDYGVSRILTGGKSGNAMVSRQELKLWNEYMQGRMILLAGSGVTSENVCTILQDTSVKEVHSSAKYSSSYADYESDLSIDPFDSNPEEIKNILHAVQSYNS